MALHEVAHDGQSKPNAAARTAVRLGLIEWLEDLLALQRGDALAVVADLDDDGDVDVEGDTLAEKTFIKDDRLVVPVD